MTCGIYLLLGSNLGDKLANLINASKQIAEIASIEKSSSVYETAAWGKTDQPSFYNVILKICTNLEPEYLLSKLLSIEENLGRVREEKWGARIIDLDILYYQDRVINTEFLKVPHPGIKDRKFTLIPLVEIASELIHPTFKKTNLELLEELNDNSSVIKLAHHITI